MSKNLRALTAIVLSQLLIEWMGFFLGIPLSKILVLTVLSSLVEILMHLFLSKKSKVTLGDKEIWHYWHIFVLFHCLGYIICLNNIKINRKN